MSTLLRRLALLAAAAALAAPAARAQQTCTAYPTQPMLRSEGISELVGEVALSCNGGDSSGANVQVQVTFPQGSFNLPITSQSIWYADHLTGALLLVADPGDPQFASFAPVLGGNAFPGFLSGNGTVLTFTVPGFGKATSMRLVNIRVNATQTSDCGGSPCAPPGAPVPMSVTAGGTAIADGSGAAPFVAAWVQTSLTTAIGTCDDVSDCMADQVCAGSGPGKRGTCARPRAPIDNGLPSKVPTLCGDPDAGLDGGGSAVSPNVDPRILTGRIPIWFREASPNAFKPRTWRELSPSVPLAQPDLGTLLSGKLLAAPELSESSYYPASKQFGYPFGVQANCGPASDPGGTGGTGEGWNSSCPEAIGLADQGTRLLASFSYLPGGVNLWADCGTDGEAGNEVQVQVRATMNAADPFRAPPECTSGGKIFKVPLNGGMAAVAWEVVGRSPSAAVTSVNEVKLHVYEVAVPLTFSGSDFTSTSCFAQSQQLNLSYGPISPACVGAPCPPAGALEPRFVDSSRPVTPTYHVAYSCETCTGELSTHTQVLIPFVESADGFDSGILISNTGGSGEGGRCKVYFEGANGPPPLTAPADGCQLNDTLPAGPPIAPGTSYAFSLYQVAPNFRGSLFFDCHFQAEISGILGGLGGITGAPSTGLEVQKVLQDRSETTQRLGAPGAKLLLAGPNAVVGFGFDTGISIIDTSVDPYFTTPRSWSATLNFYGPGGAGPFFSVNTGPQRAGGEFKYLMSSGGTDGNGQYLTPVPVDPQQGSFFYYTVVSDDPYVYAQAFTSLYGEMPSSASDGLFGIAAKPVVKGFPQSLFFPYVGGGGGFDVGISVSNTSGCNETVTLAYAAGSGRTPYSKSLKAGEPLLWEQSLQAADYEGSLLATATIDSGQPASCVAGIVAFGYRAAMGARGAFEGIEAIDPGALTSAWLFPTLIGQAGFDAGVAVANAGRAQPSTSGYQNCWYGQGCLFDPNGVALDFYSGGAGLQSNWSKRFTRGLGAGDVATADLAGGSADFQAVYLPDFSPVYPPPRFILGAPTWTTDPVSTPFQGFAIATGNFSSLAGDAFISNLGQGPRGSYTSVAGRPLGTGESYLGKYQPASGTVYADLNGNGARDPGEPGLAGVGVMICTDRCTIVATDEQGRYSLNALVRLGNAYAVQVADISGVLAGYEPLEGRAVPGQSRDSSNLGQVDVKACVQSSVDFGFRPVNSGTAACMTPAWAWAVTPLSGWPALSLTLAGTSLTAAAAQAVLQSQSRDWWTLLAQQELALELSFYQTHDYPQALSAALAQYQTFERRDPISYAQTYQQLLAFNQGTDEPDSAPVCDGVPAADPSPAPLQASALAPGQAVVGKPVQINASVFDPTLLPGALGESCDPKTNLCAFTSPAYTWQWSVSPAGAAVLAPGSASTWFTAQSAGTYTLTLTACPAATPGGPCATSSVCVTAAALAGDDPCAALTCPTSFTATDKNGQTVTLQGQDSCHFASTCEVVNGAATCVEHPLADGAVCNDGLACQYDVCQGGACVAQPAYTCLGQIAYANDFCAPNLEYGAVLVQTHCNPAETKVIEGAGPFALHCPVTVVDDTPPQFVCPGPQTLYADANCNGVADITTAIGAKDNCSAPADISMRCDGWQTLGYDQLNQALPFLCDTLVDGAGNLANGCRAGLDTCTVQYTLKDVTPPLFVDGQGNDVCPNGIWAGAPAAVGLDSSCAGTSDVSLTPHDNCTLQGKLLGGLNGASYSCQQVTLTGPGQTGTVICTASDEQGNTATCNVPVVAQGGEQCTAVTVDAVATDLGFAGFSAAAQANLATALLGTSPMAGSVYLGSGAVEALHPGGATPPLSLYAIPAPGGPGVDLATWAIDQCGAVLAGPAQVNPGAVPPAALFHWQVAPDTTLLYDVATGASVPVASPGASKLVFVYPVLPVDLTAWAYGKVLTDAQITYSTPASELASAAVHTVTGPTQLQCFPGAQLPAAQAAWTNGGRTQTLTTPSAYTVVAGHVDVVGRGSSFQLSGKQGLQFVFAKASPCATSKRRAGPGAKPAQRVQREPTLVPDRLAALR